MIINNSAASTHKAKEAVFRKEVTQMRKCSRPETSSDRIGEERDLQIDLLFGFIQV